MTFTRCESAPMISRSFVNTLKRSRAWNLWCPPMPVKLSAIRPAWWMLARIPELILRAALRNLEMTDRVANPPAAASNRREISMTNVA